MKSTTLAQVFVALSALYTLAVASPSKRSSCTIPSHFKLVNDSKLPDPFTFTDGTKVRTVEDWDCRREQLLALIQRYEAGSLPRKPARLTANITTTNNSTVLNIKATHNGKTITFSPTIIYPENPTSRGPFPAIIAYGGPSIPVPAGVVIINLNNDEIGQQNNLSSRGVGKFFDLYGVNATASSMTAWAWAVSRIIDVLEDMPSAKINTKRIAVTGCSRNGKGALLAGALDERIALTIPQESGTGGDTCWRLSDAEQAEGYVVQTSSEIVNENVWFSTDFDVFAQYNTSWLPFDHHTLAGLIAPRALLAIENTALEWLSPESSYGCMKTAHKIWEALGVPDNMGFTQVGNHSHCAFPAEQQPEVTAYFTKFLLDGKSDTNVFKTTNMTFDERAWIDWKTPSLRGK